MHVTKTFSSASSPKSGIELPEILTYSLSDNIIEKTADLIYAEFFSKGTDLNRCAIVFPGKRPALFLKKALSKRIGKSYIPPRLFSMDEFMEYIENSFGNSLRKGSEQE